MDRWTAIGAEVAPRRRQNRTRRVGRIHVHVRSMRDAVATCRWDFGPVCHPSRSSKRAHLVPVSSDTQSERVSLPCRGSSWSHSYALGIKSEDQ